MNRLLSRLALLVVAAMILSFPGIGRAELVFSQPVAHAGQVKSGQPLTQVFAFVNGGQTAVEIVDVRASCGCLKPQLSKRIFQPGENGTLVLDVNTLTQPAGPHGWRARVICRTDGIETETPVQINAELITEVKVEPPVVNMSVDRAITHEIIVTDLRLTPFSVKEVSASSPHLKGQVAQTLQDQQGHAVYRITVEVGAGLPEGKHEELVSIYTTDPAYRELRVPVLILKRARQSVTATPAEVDFFAAPGQPLPARIVLLRAAQEGKVVIERATSGNPSVTCRWAEGPNTMATLRIQMNKDHLPANGLQTTVQVEIAEPVQQTVVIPVGYRAR